MSQKDLDEHGAKARITIYFGMDEAGGIIYKLDIDGAPEFRERPDALRGLIKLGEMALQRYRLQNLPAAPDEIPEPLIRSIN